nr:hypothetical protein HmN_000641600 [Hymenolepis microstoma]
MALGDFNAHCTIWSYKNRNTAGKEIEDIYNSSPLELIYSHEDPATYLHYNGTRTTPDLLRVSNDISELTQRKIIDDPGSVHKPVIISTTINSKSMTSKMPKKEDTAMPYKVLTEPFSSHELNAAIKQLKCKMSPGEDSIHPEFLIRMGPKAKEILLTIQQNMGD